MGSITISTSLYCGVCAVICGMVYYADIDPVAPLASAFKDHGLVWAQVIVSIGAFFVSNSF